ncbi:18172_t:CDS:2, partial [Funneliformis geosporum]
AKHILNNPTAPPFNLRDVIVPNYDFPNEVYDEDFYCIRLIAEFVYLFTDRKVTFMIRYINQLMIDSVTNLQQVHQVMADKY